MSKKQQDADVEFIQSLAKLLRENDLSELEVSRNFPDETSLNVRVSCQAAVAAMVAAPVAAVAAAAIPVAADASSDPADHPGAVPSPMVGTCYLAAEPGAAVFVSVGDQVTEGQTVLIIEAMKTMNQIPSPRAGKIARILVEDGAPVEFGTPLFILE